MTGRGGVRVGGRGRGGGRGHQRSTISSSNRVAATLRRINPRRNAYEPAVYDHATTSSPALHSAAADDAARQLGKLSIPSTCRPSSPILDKIVVIVFCWYADFHTTIYVLDLNVNADIKDNKTPLPSLEAVRYLDDEWPLAMAIVVKDDSMYMFGGAFLAENGSWESDFFIYKFSSSTINSSPSQIRKTECKKGTMLSLKIGPRAVLVGNRICVFSGVSEASPSPNLEVYDILTASSFSIPGPFDSSSSSSHSCCHIYSCYIKDNSVGYFTTSYGIFSINFSLDPSDMKWKPDCIPVPPPPSRMLAPIIDDYLICSLVGYDLKASDNPTKPKFQFGNTDDWRSNLVRAFTKGQAVFMGQGMLEELQFCIVRAGLKDFKTVNQTPHLMVDIFHCFRSRSREVKVVNKKKFIFALTDNRCEDINSISAFLLKVKK